MREHDFEVVVAVDDDGPGHPYLNVENSTLRRAVSDDSGTSSLAATAAVICSGSRW